MMTFNGELFDIFSWLPAKYLVKFSLFELISNDFFITRQFINMQLVGDTDYFIESGCCQTHISHMLEVHALHANDINGENIRGSLPPEAVKFLTEESCILASCNGLLCCRNFGDKENPLVVLNPTTMNYISIPNPDESIFERDFNIIFECEDNSVDYLLMAVVLGPGDWSNEFQFKIFSPKENTWKDGGKVDIGARAMVFEFSVYLDGVVYMISDNYPFLARQSPFYWPYIVAYEIKTYSSKILELPEDARTGLDNNSKLGIFEWGNTNSSFESICLVSLVNVVFTAWVLMNNQHSSSSCSWRRVFRKRVKDMGLKQHDCDDSKVAGFTFVNGRILLFATQNEIYRCIS